MSRDILNFFAHMIEAEAGITYHESNHYQLQTRLEEFCKAEKFDGLESLHLSFKEFPNQTSRQRLIDLATNNETSFFRDPVYFKAMEEFIVQEILPKNPSSLRIWSCAASTGQEAISVAIMLDEISAKHRIPPFTILASDISKKVIDRGQDGIYSDFEVMRGISPERKHKYFNQHQSGWKVKPDMHAKITYTTNNLLASKITGPFDLILCRNVLIYQKVDIKRKILNSISKELSLGGGIILGVGETLLGLTEEMNCSFYSGVLVYLNPKIK